jgi:GNAT superfamily N-acetyltransferase
MRRLGGSPLLSSSTQGSYGRRSVNGGNVGLAGCPVTCQAARRSWSPRWTHRLSVSFTSAWDPDAGVGEVFALYVHPDHWGTGASQSLLDEAVRRLRADNLIRVVLWTHAGAPRARRFYERCGWSPTGRTQGFDFGDGRPSPIVEYAVDAPKPATA